jgi:hypothetical protein
MSATSARNLADWLAVRGLTLVPLARSNQRDKHVVLTIDGFRTRVQFPPGPPAKANSHLRGGCLLLVIRAALMLVRCYCETSNSLMASQRSRRVACGVVLVAPACVTRCCLLSLAARPHPQLFRYFLFPPQMGLPCGSSLRRPREYQRLASAICG